MFTMSLAPEATVIATKGRTVTILCPYCGHTHTHAVEAIGATERHAPGCGLYRSAADRAAGYMFTTPKHDQTERN